jgi:hypothetical protein
MVCSKAHCVEPQLGRGAKQGTGRHERERKELKINVKGKETEAFFSSTCIKLKQC